MSRTNQILSAVLALQIVLAAVIFWPRPAASIAGGEKLFPGLEAEQVVRLTVSDAEGNQIELAKGAEGWVLPEADDYATEGTKVPDFLTQIVEIRTNRLVTQTPGSHKRLKVASEDYQRLVEFELADGTTHELYLGTSPSYKVTHVRADGQDKAAVEKRVRRALASAQKYSLVANSIKGDVIVEPEIDVL